MTKIFNDEELAKIAKHKKMAESMSFRQEVFDHFAPTFFYTKDEENFPGDPNDLVKNVMEAKHEYYESRDDSKLDETERKEKEIIQKYFWKDGKFNPNYDEFRNEPDYQATLFDQSACKKFMTFDEKKYGYPTGSKIDCTGVAPKGHPKYDPNKPSAPIASCITPTPDGFFIQYDYTYPLNNAIPGMQWAYKLLPNSVANAAQNFGFHYGDCEGVGMFVKVDDNGKMSLDSMQTFAHGAKGARRVDAKDCTFEDGRVCVFVGEGGHPSYADNFIGRNKFLDRVGTAYKITPEKFSDVSSDIIKLAQGKVDPNTESKEKQDVAATIPKAWHAVRNMSDSNPLSTVGTKAAEDILSEEKLTKWNKYKPILVLEKAWKKIKEFAGKVTGRKTNPPEPIKDFDASRYASKDGGLDLSEGHSNQMAKSQSKSVNKGNAWATKIGSKEERDLASRASSTNRDI